MTEYLFDHDRRDVYRLSIEYVANAFDTSRCDVDSGDRRRSSIEAAGAPWKCRQRLNPGC